MDEPIKDPTLSSMQTRLRLSLNMRTGQRTTFGLTVGLCAMATTLPGSLPANGKEAAA